MQRRAVLREVEIWIAIFRHGVDVDAQFEQLPHSGGIPDARKFYQQLAALCNQFANELRFLVNNGPHTGRVIPCAGGDQPLDAFKLEGNSSPLEQFENIATSSSRRH